MRVVGGHGGAQPSMRGVGCWYHSLEQPLESPVAAQDGAESHKWNPQCSPGTPLTVHRKMISGQIFFFSSSVEILLFQ